MKIRKSNAIGFGITLVSANRTGNANPNIPKRGLTIRRKTPMQGKAEQISRHELDCPRTKMPPQGKPFTPDLFISEPVPLPSFPPPRKLKLFSEEESIHDELDCFRSRTAPDPASKKTTPMALSILWGFFKVIFAGVFIALKYAFIAVAVIITIGCMICAGRQTTGLR